MIPCSLCDRGIQYSQQTWHKVSGSFILDLLLCSWPWSLLFVRWTPNSFDSYIGFGKRECLLLNLCMFFTATAMLALFISLLSKQGSEVLSHLHI